MGPTRSVGSQIARITTVLTAVLVACSDAGPRPEPASVGGDRVTRETAAPTRDGDASGMPAEGDTEDGAGGTDAAPATFATNESIVVDGAPRSFVLAVPQSYSPSRSYPLVLVLHGDGGDGPSIRAALSFDEASGADAIVAYPSGRLGWNLYDPADQNPDFRFLVALVESLESRFAIDPGRVFGMGFSSGAFMLNQVACRRPTFFRAIAPHSGGAPDEPRDPSATRWSNDYTRCSGQTLGNGPAVMVIHGTADRVVTFDSGDFTAMYWAYVDGCQTSRSTEFAPSPCVSHDACPSDRPVVLCAVPELAHVLWSGARDAVWSFFRTL